MLLPILILTAAMLAAQSGLPELLQKVPAARVSVEKIAAPAGIGYPSSVAMHPNGLLYVLQRNLRMAPVMALDTKTGRVLHQFGNGMFQIPHAIRVHSDGRIFTVDSASSQVHQFTPEGRHLRTIEVGGQPKTSSQFNGATDVAFAPDGRLFISDGYGNARILVYSADGKLLRTFGEAGARTGEFAQPHSVAILGTTLYVADRRNNRLQLFDLEGRPLAQWGHLGMVTGLAAGGGKLWVGTQLPELPTSSNGYLLQIDPKSGRILTQMESRHAHHILNLTLTGDPVSGARPDAVYVFRMAKK